MVTGDENDLDIEKIKEVFIMTQHHKKHHSKVQKKKLGLLALNQDRSKKGEINF